MRSSIQKAGAILLVGAALLAWSPTATAATETIDVGSMSCYPGQGLAKSGNVAVGSADSGTYILRAFATYSGAGPTPTCTFEIDIRESEIQFSGCQPGPLGSCGGITGKTLGRVAVAPGGWDYATIEFDWWRAAHAVSFTVPFDLKVNEQVVASGSFTFMDPPFWDELT